jgi:acyl-homoserine-lactone acylase
MKRILLIVLFGLCACSPQSTSPGAAAPNSELDAWKARAREITIVRDDWGIAHVHGKTDADAVFGMIYAQAEDDFNRVETNYLLSQGRLAEALGEKEIWRDLRMRLFIDPSDMQAKYAICAPWLKALMNAWADGLNFFLATHPQVKPKVLTRFEPWMALTFSEGSIGGDIESVSLPDLQAFYDTQHDKTTQTALADTGPYSLAEPKGSNGFAIAPANSASKHALLWINPHTSFFFRSEAHVTSDEGLNVYGASTWGQFFVYQGFNEHAGWMHTSSGVDNIDEYIETITPQGNGFTYRHGTEQRAVQSRKVTIRYKTPSGTSQRDFTIYRTEHGPMVRSANGKWIATHLMEEPVKALTQSYTRTKAHNLAEFKQIMNLHTDSSNNTVFADSDGNIAFFDANFIPKRDAKFDWTKPVDGSDPATDWHEPLSVDESPNIINPKGGWLYNTNNAPWTDAGADSPNKKDYPAYVDRYEDNPRGVHATRVLSQKKDFTPDTLIQAAFDSQLPGLEKLMPKFAAAFDALPAKDPRRQTLAGPIAELKRWDVRWAANSIATTLAVLASDNLWERVKLDAETENASIYEYLDRQATPQQRLDSLTAVVERLTKDFGKWQVPWGDINRFQRLTDDIEHPFDDNAPSIAVPFATGRWGSLASFGASRYHDSKKFYGTGGNSFLAVVEFGDNVRAKAVTAGGEGGDPKSPHFNDQAERYASGNLREVYFYPEQLKGHTEREYHPGE